MEELSCQRLAGFPGAGLLTDEIAEGSHLVVERPQCRVLSEEILEALALVVSEPVGPFAQGGELAAVVVEIRDDGAEEFHEVMVDDAHDVEAIGHDPCPWEESADEGAVGVAHVDADELDAISPL